MGLSIYPELFVPLVLSWITIEEHRDNNLISSGFVLRTVYALAQVIRPKRHLHTKTFCRENHSIFDF